MGKNTQKKSFIKQKSKMEHDNRQNNSNSGQTKTRKANRTQCRHSCANTKQNPSVMEQNKQSRSSTRNSKRIPVLSSEKENSQRINDPLIWDPYSCQNQLEGHNRNQNPNRNQYQNSRTHYVNTRRQNQNLDQKNKTQIMYVCKSPAYRNPECAMKVFSSTEENSDIKIIQNVENKHYRKNPNLHTMHEARNGPLVNPYQDFRNTSLHTYIRRSRISAEDNINRLKSWIISQNIINQNRNNSDNIIENTKNRIQDTGDDDNLVWNLRRSSSSGIVINLTDE